MSETANHRLSARATYSGPLSGRMGAGSPRWQNGRAGVEITSSALMDHSTSMVGTPWFAHPPMALVTAAHPRRGPSLAVSYPRKVILMSSKLRKYCPRFTPDMLT